LLELDSDLSSESDDFGSLTTSRELEQFITLFLLWDEPLLQNTPVVFLLGLALLLNNLGLAVSDNKLFAAVLNLVTLVVFSFAFSLTYFILGEFSNNYT
jgi:hypothetical protein